MSDISSGQILEEKNSLNACYDDNAASMSETPLNTSKPVVTMEKSTMGDQSEETTKSPDKSIRRQPHRRPIGGTTGRAPMYVVKRDGSTEPLSFDKITLRVDKLSYNLDERVDTTQVAQKVIVGLKTGITTSEIDQEAARIAAMMTNQHPHYAILAARFLVSDLHRSTIKRFSRFVEKASQYIHPKTDRLMPLISDEIVRIVREHADVIDAAIVHNRDNGFNYFGLKTLMRSYLLKMDGKVVESPQHMYMRVALGIHGDDIESALRTYDLMSRAYISHASPTMFNAGTPKPQLASCFLLQLPGDQDSIDSIFEGLANCAKISKTAGGIGLALHNIRSEGSYIAGTNGTSNGLVPMLRVFNNAARYVDQGGNKRPGAFAIYIEPWHADIFKVLELKHPQGMEELRARDLFYGLWIPDLFMRRVEADESWTLMCPHECPGLPEHWGPEFEALYETYEREGKGRETIPARKLWNAIISTIKMTGTPYMLYKDHANAKSNQKHMGTIQSSNLCVGGNTYITTEEGPRSIEEIVRANEPKPEEVEQSEDRARTLEQLERVKIKREGKAQRSKPTNNLDTEIAALEAKLEALPEPKISKPKSRTVRVWNGVEWSEVEPKQTNPKGEKVELLRVTTSHGTVLDCTPYHKWILADGETRVEASQLMIGTRLVATPPVKYKGRELHELKPDTAFRRGFVYAYALMKRGADPSCLGPRPPALRVTGLEVRKSVVTQEALERLGYDLAKVQRMYPKYDHTSLAYIELPESEQTAQDRLTGPLETRKQWSAGFLCATGGQLGEVRGCHMMVNRARMMLRSVGEDARMRLVDRDGLWQLHWPTKDDVAEPYVIGIQKLGGKYDTFCFEESQRHAGVFNEQLTGQCSEIIEYSAPDEIAVCLGADTLVATRQGLRPIVECDGIDVVVPFKSDEDFEARPADKRFIKATLINNGEHPVYELTTTYNATKATANHRFLVLDPKTQTPVWRRVEHLCVGDQILRQDAGEYAKVLSLERKTTTETVYDLSVPGGYHFVANGMISHNCNLSSVVLNKFVDTSGKEPVFDFKLLHEVTKIMVLNMNRVIDRSLYVIEDMKKSNLRHRPMGIGVQGWADAMVLMKYPIESSPGTAHPDCFLLNRQMFETMYHAALEASCELAMVEGAYETYPGSPVSQGILQYDMWGVTPTDLWDWTELKAKIAKHGLRNSLLLTCMPTASTAQILGNNESIEPFTSNMYTRSVLSGEFQVVNKYLMDDLINEGLWDEEMRLEIIANNGSVQAIERIPKRLRDLYKTVWEIRQKTLIDLAADRGAFICQSQSFNVHMFDPTDNQLTSALFYGWRKKLKTGMYYLRTRAAMDAVKVVVDPDKMAEIEARKAACKLENREECLMCSA